MWSHFIRRTSRRSLAISCGAVFSLVGYMEENVSLCDHMPEKSRFLDHAIASKIRKEHGTPAYVYDENCILNQIRLALQFPHAFGLRVRFAVKAFPNCSAIRIMADNGVWFDASSGYEVLRIVKAGVDPKTISLSSQELPHDFVDLIKLGIEFNACSIHQLEEFGKAFPGRSCGIRFNPGAGSGSTNKTNVGGPNASFGIWYGFVDEVKGVVDKYGLKITRIHTHIGSGSDPSVWQNVSALSLAIMKHFPTADTLNLGGGYKVARMAHEKATDLQSIGAPVKDAFLEFSKETGRELKLEIEPGTFLVANCGSLLCTIQDIVSTIDNNERSSTGLSNVGYNFIKLDTGMTEILRPSMYGARHPIVVLQNPKAQVSASGVIKYAVVGHCCESGDLMTPESGNSDVLESIYLPQSTTIGDLVSIEATGAYCSSMSAKNYNSFPEAPEVLISHDGEIRLIRRRQTLDQIIQNELLSSNNDGNFN